MIISQLRQILADPHDAPGRLNQLVDEFREDRDAAELMELLNSGSGDLIRIGTWILSEVRSDKYDSPAMVDRLHELTTHQTPAIRLHSLSALFPFLSGEDPSTVDLIARMQNDANEGVRMAAEAAAQRLGIAE